MLRVLLCVFLLIFVSLPQASLHPGWREAGWLEDLDTARQKSRQSGKPIFLYFDAIWCSWCQEYKRKTLDKPDVQRKLTQDYIPLVIDYDARPQLFNQLGGRGLPFNVIMDANDRVRNRFVGLLDVTDLLALLDKFDSRSTPAPIAFDAEGFEPVTINSLDQNAFTEFRDAFLRHIEVLYSQDHKTLAGFYESGVTLKRPSPLTWMWLAEQAEWKQRTQLAAETEANRLWDKIDGGFFQYLQSTPPLADYLETSKLLEVNVRLAQWMARAGEQSKQLQHIARQAVTYLQSQLRDNNTDGFFQSQLADQAYYQLPEAQRKKLSPPTIDKIIRMDTNAQTVIALLDLSRSLKDAQLVRQADKTFQFLISKMIRDYQRFHLYVNGKLEHPAELADLAWLLAAGLELERIASDNKRQRQLADLSKQLQKQLDRLMEKTSDNANNPETLGLVAWIVTHPVSRKHTELAIPLRYAHWALKQTRLEADTPPDSLVYALDAWQQLLAN